ncbi:hypothetical protein EEB13_08070 [Rhodococcus sp. WS3]|nr:hypothetical protein EEB13_08070 [Rhodococcus sp. WS3]
MLASAITSAHGSRTSPFSIGANRRDQPRNNECQQEDDEQHWPEEERKDKQDDESDFRFLRSVRAATDVHLSVAHVAFVARPHR